MHVVLLSEPIDEIRCLMLVFQTPCLVCAIRPPTPQLRYLCESFGLSECALYVPLVRYNLC